MEFRRTEPHLQQYLHRTPPPPSYVGGHRNPGFGGGFGFYDQGMGHTNDFFPLGIGQASGGFQMMNNVSAHPEYLRDLEKQRIREEIISGDIIRRRVLEEEVRAELMMENEFRYRLRSRGGNAYYGYLVQGESGGLAAGPRRSLYGREANKGVYLEEIHSEEWLDRQERSRIQGFDRATYQERSTKPVLQDTAPFQRRRVDSKVQKAKPSMQQKRKDFVRKFTPVVKTWKIKDKSCHSGEKCAKSALAVMEAQTVGKMHSMIQEGTKQLDLEERVAAQSEKGLRTHSRCETQVFDVDLKKTLQAKPSFALSGTKRKFESVDKRNVCEPSGIGNKRQKKTLKCETQVFDVDLKKTLQAKPNVALSGKKRKFESVDKRNVCEPSGVGNKRQKKTWKCDVCQICTTNEGGLNAHLGGRKHKIMEKALNDKNRKARKIKDKSKFVFWCEMCQVGTGSESVMEAHESGKMHSNKKLYLERTAAHSKAGSKTQSRCKTVAFDGVFQGRSVGSKVQQTASPAMKNGKHEKRIVFLAKPSADLSGTKLKFEAAGEGKVCEPSSVRNKKGMKTWICDACQICTTSERALNDHLGGKKHKAMEVAKNGKNIGVGAVSKATSEPIAEELEVAKEMVKNCTILDIWNKPTNGLKMNVDASFPDNGRAGIGIVVRDRNGHCLHAYYENTTAISSMHAEMLAIRKSLKLAGELGLKDVVIESDCKMAIDGVHAPPSVQWQHYSLANKIKDKLNGIQLAWTRRCCNRAADFLAKEALLNQPGSSAFIAWNQMPERMKEIIMLDQQPFC